MNPDNEQLNPNFVNLAKAIGQAESGGNYNAKSGDSSSYPSSAYQFTPGFIQKYAPSAGIKWQPGQQLSVGDQNKLAYTAVKSMAGQGLSAAKIAWAWNAGQGSLDDFGDEEYGKNNKYGSTMNYVRQVEKNYAALGGQNGAQSQPTQNAQSTPPSEPNLGDYLKGAFGIGAGVVGSVLGGIKSIAPELGAIGGEELAGPVGAIGGGMLGNAIKGSGDTGGGGGSGEPQFPQPQPFEEPQPSKQSQILSNLVGKSLETTQTGRNFASSDDGQQGVAAMGTYGYTPEINNGAMSFGSAMEKADQNASKAATIEMMAAGGSQVPLAGVINDASTLLEENRLLTPKQREEAQRIVGEEARSYGNSNSSISGEEAVRARHQQYKASKNKFGQLSTPQYEAHKALGRAFRAQALKYSKNPELQESAIREQQKHINAKKVMKHLEGKRAPKDYHPFKEALLKTAARYAEVYIGDKIGGPIGAVLAYWMGGHLDRKLQRHLSKTSFETKEAKAAMDILKETKPEVYDKMIAMFKSYHEPFTPEKEPENKTPQATAKDVQGDLKTIKGLISVSKRKSPTLKSRRPLQSPRNRPK